MTMNPEELITLNEEIAGMARAGLPLDQGLAALAREMTRGRLKQATVEIAGELKAGRTLPEALANQGSRVPPFYAGLVEAGIRSGRLGEVMATLTIYARSVSDLEMMITGNPEHNYPYAGVPWFSTVFGRDGIITALQVLWLNPEIARGVLQFLADTQAEKSDPVADSEVMPLLLEAGFVAGPRRAVLRP